MSTATGCIILFTITKVNINMILVKLLFADTEPAETLGLYTGADKGVEGGIIRIRRPRRHYKDHRN
jgi:hypothetical protein